MGDLTLDIPRDRDGDFESQVVKKHQTDISCIEDQVISMDAIHYNVRQDNAVIKKAVYIAIGIKLDGTKEIMGMWIGDNESAKYWLGVLNEIKNRGTEDILIVSVYGLTGFGDVIHAVFYMPRFSVVLCIRYAIPPGSYPIRISSHLWLI